MSESAANPSRSLSPKLLRWIGLGVAVLVLWILLPPFRIVSLDEKGKVPQRGQQTAAFEPAAFVAEFWREKLVPSMDEATPLEALLRSVEADPAAAKEQFARQAGEGGIAYYFAGGQGTVVDLKGRRAVLDTAGGKISLLVAPPVFGNLVRDGTGLLNVNDFRGLEEYNAISAVLNQKIENEVMSDLKDRVVVGAKLAFVGCAKAPDAVGEGPALEFIPLRVESAK